MAGVDDPNPALEPNIVEILSHSRKQRSRPKKIHERLVFEIKSTALAAIEYPFPIDEIDEALTHFGSKPEWGDLLENDPNTAVPHYFDTGPAGRPVMSSNIATDDLLVKITVPKRTGRRRKKGSNGAWEYHQPKRKQQGPYQRIDTNGLGIPYEGPAETFIIRKYPPLEFEDDNFEEEQQRRRLYDQSSMIPPQRLLRILQDNVGRYKLEGIGHIKRSHRFRALADFHQDMSESPFLNEFVSKVLNGNLASIKEFHLRSDTKGDPGDDFIAPPIFTNLSLPFQYYYEQNPNVRVRADVGEGNTMWNLVNVQRSSMNGHHLYITYDHVGVPQGPPEGADIGDDPELFKMVLELQSLVQERPIWTRRSIFNAMETEVRSWDLFKRAMQYVSYQFRSGPWKHAVIRFGVDPRTDPKYRKYQTLQFKLFRSSPIAVPTKYHHKHAQKAGSAGDTSSDGDEVGLNTSRHAIKYYHDANPESHLFDGKEYSGSGRVWQVCDITDPLLSRLLSEAQVRPTCSLEDSGWFHSGLWRKVTNIMRLKLIGIRFKKPVHDEDFGPVIREYPDLTPPPEEEKPYFLLPNLHLTQKEMLELRGNNIWRKNTRPGPGQKYLSKGKVETMTTKVPH